MIDAAEGGIRQGPSVPGCAALFDLDGVLVNTEALKSRAHVATGRSFGCDVPPSSYGRVIGQSGEAVATGAIEAGRIPATVRQYSERFTTIYLSTLLDSVHAAPGAHAFIAALRRRGCRCAVVSSNPRSAVVDILGWIGLAASIDLIVSADDVAVLKPSPEPCLRALDSLAVVPSAAVAFEDTEPGLRSARAGLPVITIRHSLNALHDFGEAVATVDDFSNGAALTGLIALILGPTMKLGQ